MKFLSIKLTEEIKRRFDNFLPPDMKPYEFVDHMLEDYRNKLMGFDKKEEKPKETKKEEIPVQEDFTEVTYQDYWNTYYEVTKKVILDTIDELDLPFVRLKKMPNKPVEQLKKENEQAKTENNKIENLTVKETEQPVEKKRRWPFG